MTLARRGRAVRKSLREVIAQNNASDRFYAAMAGKEPRAQSVIAPVRAYTKRTASDDLEAAVSIEVGQLLATHPRIIFAIRQNTGATADYVWFYRWIKSPNPMTITDYIGFMFAGEPLRAVPFAIECKRRDWKFTGRIEREELQREYIQTIIDCGGRGGFVTSAEQALEILK